MDLINQVFHEYLDFGIVVLTDDTLIYSTNCVEHGRHLVIVLEVLENKNTQMHLCLNYPRKLLGMWFAQIHHDRARMRPSAKRPGCGLCFWATVNHEKHYSTHDLELATVVYALLSCRQCLYGEVCEIHTYHPSLNALLC
jgi:hypothetical protein